MWQRSYQRYSGYVQAIDGILDLPHDRCVGERCVYQDRVGEVLVRIGLDTRDHMHAACQVLRPNIAGDRDCQHE